MCEKNELTHEIKKHGTKNFPYMVYHGKIPEYLEEFNIHWHDEMEILF